MERGSEPYEPDTDNTGVGRYNSFWLFGEHFA